MALARALLPLDGEWSKSWQQLRGWDIDHLNSCDARPAANVHKCKPPASLFQARGRCAREVQGHFSTTKEVGGFARRIGKKGELPNRATLGPRAGDLPPK